MARITKAILDKKVEMLNRIMSLSVWEGYTLNYAHGGVMLCCYVNENGAVTQMSERVGNAEMARILDTLINTVARFKQV